MLFRYKILSFLFILLFLNSCVFKELRNSKEEISSLKKEKSKLRAELENQRKNDEALIITLNHEVDSLKKEVSYLKGLLPQELLNDIDSLNGELEVSKMNLNRNNKTIISLIDSLNRLDQIITGLYKLPGNEAKRVTTQQGVYDCYIVDVKQSNVEFFWQNEHKKPLRNLRALEDFLSSKSKILAFATNAGMYEPNNAPKGLFIQNGQKIIPIDRRKEEYGNFYMQPNGVFMIDKERKAKILVTEQFDTSMFRQTNFATQSGPMLLVEGKINSKFTPNSKNKRIRSGVGIINESKIVFVISNRPASFYDFASVFKNSFNCKDALYLDGAISEMYLPELKRFQKGGNFGPIIGITK